MAAGKNTITIVGRQNVGKSTLFNSLLKEKKAIVDSRPGLTRDILSCSMSFDDYHFILSDTPGLDLPSSSELSAPILDNAKKYLSKSQVIIFLMEHPSPRAFDLDLADILRKLDIPVVTAVNKMDSPARMEEMSNFWELGFQDIVPVSALNRANIDMLLAKATALLPRGGSRSTVEEPDIRIAVVGRPNSGKSTLLNSFLGYERSVVSDIPGTTRDPVDDSFRFHGSHIEIIDTAGIRKKGKMEEDVEYYSFKRTVNAIEKCDVAIHLIDAEIGLTDTDKKISDEIIRVSKPAIICINKWDLIEKDTGTFKEFKDKIIFKFYKAGDFPILSISAKGKKRISKILSMALALKEKASFRVDTPLLNKILETIQKRGRVPKLGSQAKIFYATQTDTLPPRFKLFVNNPEFFRRDMIRHIEKTLQSELELEGIPMVFSIEGKKKRK